jgi:hypothetical protein
MIYTILEKCLAELDKEEIDASYLKGMIETLLAMQPQITPIFPARPIGSIVPVDKPTDDAAILDAKARVAIGYVKAMSEASTE